MCGIVETLSSHAHDENDFSALGMWSEISSTKDVCGSCQEMRFPHSRVKTFWRFSSRILTWHYKGFRWHLWSAWLFHPPRNLGVQAFGLPHRRDTLWRPISSAPKQVRQLLQLGGSRRTSYKSERIVTICSIKNKVELKQNKSSELSKICRVLIPSYHCYISFECLFKLRMKALNPTLACLFTWQRQQQLFLTTSCSNCENSTKENNENCCYDFFSFIINAPEEEISHRVEVEMKFPPSGLYFHVRNRDN